MESITKLFFIVVAVIATQVVHAKNFTLSTPVGSEQLITLSDFKNQTYPGVGGMTVYFKYKPHADCFNLNLHLEVLDKDNSVVLQRIIQGTNVRAEQSYKTQFMVEGNEISAIRFAKVWCQVTYGGEILSFPPYQSERGVQRGTPNVGGNAVSQQQQNQPNPLGDLFKLLSK